ncbi:MAG: hypothetical protein KBD76_14150 [Bacteriovorax sp.]|nr:hypothetical protein [Bacteriovorax sp.]
MKRFKLLLFSITIALGIAFYSKRSSENYSQNLAQWKTFVKKSPKKITQYQSTETELMKARIPSPRRSIASNKPAAKNFKMLKDLHYQFREGRVLFGDNADSKNYQDEQTPLEMINKVDPKWDEILGTDLLRLHQDDTKVMVKSEYPLIKIQNGKGLYIEQVIITYLFADGHSSSFHALVDSETGFVLETWNRTVNENVHKKGAGIPLPEINNSGIIGK